MSEGAEGQPPRTELSLRAVVLTIRHGDRSSIHAIPGALSSQGRFSCASAELESTWSELPQRFRIVSVASGAPIDRKMRPELRPGGADEECDFGQLTARGFRQHLELGAHLAKAYRGLLEALAVGGGASGALYLRSTDYTRTLGSAAALLTKMLPWQLWPKSAVPLNIAVHEDEAEEVMHGIGAKTSSKGTDGSAERVVHGTCAASVRHSTAQREVWRNPEAEFERIRKIFGEDAYHRGVTEIVDALYSPACHGLPPPRGTGGCVEPTLGAALARSADEYYCARFAGAEGGAKGTHLAMQPFLAEVVARLQRGAAASTAGAGPELALFSGHDTVVAPVLSALGVYKGRLCGWPPYASRVAFELYSAPPQAADAGTHYVRVVYNGEAVLGVRGCDDGVELCPLENFTHGIQSLLGGKPDLAAACQ